MERIRHFLHARARWIAAGLAVVCLGLTVYYFTAQRFVSSTVSLTRRHEATTLGEGDVIEQAVQFAEGDLALIQGKIQVQVGTYQNQYKTGTLTVTLLEQGGSPVGRCQKQCAEILDNSYVGIETAELQPEHPYTIRIELHGFEDPGLLAIWTGEPVPETEEDAESKKSALVGTATKNGHALTDSEDEQLYVSIKGLETERGVQWAYYPLTALLVVGSVFWLLPSSKGKTGKQEGEQA